MFGGKKITVTLAPYGLAARLLTAGEYEIKAGSRLKALLKQAGLPRGTPPLVCMIRGDRVEIDRTLAAGDEVKVFQFAGGG